MLEYPRGLGKVSGRAELRRENAAHDKAVAPACRKNLLRVRLLVFLEVCSSPRTEGRGIIVVMSNFLPRRRSRVEGLSEVWREVENDLEPPIGLVGDLEGRPAQVSLRAKQNIE